MSVAPLTQALASGDLLEGRLVNIGRAHPGRVELPVLLQLELRDHEEARAVLEAVHEARGTPVPAAAPKSWGAWWATRGSGAR